MKRIATLLVLMAMGSSLFAAASFFLRITTGGNYTVSLNNQTITSPASIFRFHDLYPGVHVLKVYDNNYGGRLLYNKPITITNGFRTIAELHPQGGLSIIDKLPYTSSSWYLDQVYSPQGNPFPGPRPHMPQGPRPGCANGCICYDQYGWGMNYPSAPYYPNNYPNNYPFPNNGFPIGNLIDDASFNSLVQTMKNASFDDKMLETAKSALKNRTIKTAQVEELMRLFTFERNKLDLAKYCYDKTIDRDNYFQLYDAFTFNSSSTELDKYIQSK